MRLLAEVCDRSAADRMTTPIAPADILPFLREFYTAERAFLEHEQLFGKTRADKHAAAATRRLAPAPPGAFRSVEHRSDLLDVEPALATRRS